MQTLELKRAKKRAPGKLLLHPLPGISTDHSIIISRNDVVAVHDYARAKCCARDYLLIRLPMKIGLRTGEICTLRIENINFEKRTFQVLDSKRKVFYPLPLDPVTLDLIQQLVGDRSEGYVFRQTKTWKTKRVDRPLKPNTVWIRVRLIAEEAGVNNFSPRVLRHYFASEWHRSGRSLEVLRRILRHKSLAYTQFYLARLVCLEDVQREYDQVMNGPLAEFADAISKFGPVSAGPFSGLPDTAAAPAAGPCSACDIVQVCKYAGSLPEYATGCRFRQQKAKEITVPSLSTVKNEA
jgi:integrase